MAKDKRKGSSPNHAGNFKVTNVEHFLNSETTKRQIVSSHDPHGDSTKQHPEQFSVEFDFEEHIAWIPVIDREKGELFFPKIVLRIHKATRLIKDFQLTLIPYELGIKLLQFERMPVRLDRLQ